MSIKAILYQCLEVGKNIKRYLKLLKLVQKRGTFGNSE